MEQIKWLKLVCLSLLLLSWQVLAANQINSVRIWPSPGKTRVVLDLTEKPDFKHFTLSRPNRFVIDLKKTRKSIDLTKIPLKGSLIKKIRYSKPKYRGSQRVVIELNKKSSAKIFPLAPTAPYGNRLVIDFADGDSKKSVYKTTKNTTDRDIVIAIDAGHGGEDPGSIGSRGNYEKRITYQISKKLADKLNRQKGMSAVMVRTGDYYVGLNKRSEIARKAKADLLLSIHADAFTSPGPNGASVWVLSMKRANTEIGRWMEKREKHSQLLGGAAEVIKDTKNERYLAKALLDMSMDHSMETSYGLSRMLVSEMGKVTKLHKKEPQTASLAVLKSPDIPSLLIETGFISNPKEEKRLTQKDHQVKLSNAIFKAVHRFFKTNPPDGSMYAKLYRQSNHHIVRRGESLSLLAKRYNVTVSQLKRTNKLRSDILKIGQKLKIPKS